MLHSLVDSALKKSNCYFFDFQNLFVSLQTVYNLFKGDISFLQDIIKHLFKGDIPFFQILSLHIKQVHGTQLLFMRFKVPV